MHIIREREGGGVTLFIIDLLQWCCCLLCCYGNQWTLHPFTIKLL